MLQPAVTNGDDHFFLLKRGRSGWELVRGADGISVCLICLKNTTGKAPSQTSRLHSQRWSQGFHSETERLSPFPVQCFGIQASSSCMTLRISPFASSPHVLVPRFYSDAAKPTNQAETSGLLWLVRRGSLTEEPFRRGHICTAAGLRHRML